MDPIALSIFVSRIEAICEEMGVALRRSAFSPNIKDRLDFSCAVFDPAGQLCAQAAHIPVHLGSMAYAMADLVACQRWQPGDMVIVNDPFLGGTHLPDVTVIAPLFVGDTLCAFVANRAHHADIGAQSPGSMPLSSRLEEEGLVIPPTLLVRGGVTDQNWLKQLLAPLRCPQEAQGDFSAQISANRVGLERLTTLVAEQGVVTFNNGLAALNDYGERLARAALADIPDGVYRYTDWLDDDGQGQQNLPITVGITVAGGTVEVDFTGTVSQVSGNVNCPLSVAAAAVYYVFRCLMPSHAPACAGSFRPIRLSAPLGSLLNAQRPAAVAAGNVETSQRVVDVLLGALAQALPEIIPAAAYGSMNNVAMGAAATDSRRGWDYYETLGGGLGGGAHHPGLSGVQGHMTNTLNTPIEALEMAYPLQVTRYALRRGSGGSGHHPGGDGIVREYRFLMPTQVTLLTERRCHAPWGLAGGEPGMVGSNTLDGEPLPGKCSFIAQPGQCLTIETPGGGGWGSVSRRIDPN